MKNTVFVSSVVFCLFVLYSMASLAVSRYIFAKESHKNFLVEVQISDKAFSVTGLEKALQYLPVAVVPFQNFFDKNRVHGYIGRTFLNMAGQLEDKDSPEYVSLLKKARHHHRQAVDFNPYDNTTAKGMADTMYAMEKAGIAGCDALPFFERLHDLGPTHVENQFSIAAYYHYKGMENALFKKMAHLVKIYPANYGKLKKEPYYAPQARPWIQKGLAQSIHQNINKKSAYFEMGRFLMDEGRYTEAAAYYSDGINMHPYENSVDNYLILGRLLLKDQQYDRAFLAFETALNHNGPTDNILHRIYGYFQRDRLYDEFLRFCRLLETRKDLDAGLGILVARARMAQGFFELAKARLLQLNPAQHTHEVFYLLAKIGEAQQDWDAMELNSQKATVLAPENCHYHALFAKSLRLQDKHIQAEVQQNTARKCKTAKKK